MHLPAPIAQWSIHRLMLVGFGLVFVLVTAVSIMAYDTTATLIANTKLDARSHRVIKGVDELMAMLEDSERAYRRFLVTGDQSYLDGQRTASELIPAYVLTFAEFSDTNAEQKERVHQLEIQIQRLFDIQRAGIAQRVKHGYQGVRPLIFGKEANRELESARQLLATIAEAENTTLYTRLEVSAQNTRLSVWLLAAATVLQFVLLGSVYLLIRHDIAERERVAQELLRRGEQLEAANKELEAFSYSVSHDLRAPLRHIDGYVALLDKAAGNDLSEKARRYLTTIAQSAKQMGQLIDDLLSFSRMGRAEMMTTRVDLNDLMKDVLQRVQQDTHSRSITWNIAPLPTVQGDPSMLRQVFVNLVANAIKFTSTRPDTKIEIGVEMPSPGEVVVFVRDNGVGFDMKYAEKLFGVFQRLHRAEEFEGTGIGLANVRRIVHRHGGRTWATSEPDHGATFFVSLKQAA